ncbi:MAG: DUF2252 domain-containing protein [Methylobacterium sp.]|uniref:DUF2252 family protein n=1 Tax=Methylobacterium sp. TaxID=409 RepID=UPI0025853ED5|nr:DUF2252 family protein [Methylobacterium sp.]MBY0297200.1 DUF2252 domain-containing protein [Methylobacterium sp.]
MGRHGAGRHGEAASFEEETSAYLDWAQTYCKLRDRDLARKQEKMRESPFAFLRGTFYRWHHHFAAVADQVRFAPGLLVVGDTHLENFGTWRDAEGRLVWGVNDVDEAAVLPFTSDLVRLAASATLEAESAGFHLGADEAVDAILEGYAAHLRFGPEPFILEDRHVWLRDLATANGAEAREHWRKLLQQKAVEPDRVPEPALTLLRESLPKGAREIRFFRRQAGVGSLGRPRFAAVAEWQGGLVAREAKAALPSAVHAGAPGRLDPIAEARALLAAACRAPDPAFRLAEGWVVRRLSPEARKVEIDEIENLAGQRQILHAMGRELANVHLGTAKGPGPLRAYLEALPDPWLRDAARDAARRVREDYDAFIA